MAIKTALVPDNYDGRVQAWIKHQLLEAYFEKLLMIIGMSAKSSRKVEICYVDCFAGPWGDDSQDMQGTSIAISLRTMAECKRMLAKLGVDATMRALYIEIDKKAHTRLADHLAVATPAGVDAQCKHGDFLDFRQDILDWCGTSAFTFFFIDPKGWMDVGVEKLRPLLMRPRSEFLINFIYDFINRTASMASWQQDIAEFLGAPLDVVQKLVGQSAEHREAQLLGSYRTGLKAALPQKVSRYRPRTAYVRVLDPDKERAKYHLVYLTTHPKGIVEFMGISEGVDLIQHRVRAARRSEAREAKTGVVDLFSEDDRDDVQPNLASPSDVDQFWLEYLDAEPRAINEDVYADILEATDWMPGDLQASLVRLIKMGKVVNLDAPNPRPKWPLHYKTADRLVLKIQG